jgi:molecular chaperone HtpG
MAIKITDECINCGACEPECPNNAIYEGGVEWAVADGTSVKGSFTLMDGSAVDASQKIKTLASLGEFKGELGDIKVTVSIDKEAKTITVSDRGIGLTADEIEKYINQVAFSGATEFVEKYKDKAELNNMIGNFGLGFYSAFMVAKNVEIQSLAHYPDATAVHWICDGSTSFEISAGTRVERGSDVILHIAEDSEEFLDSYRLKNILTKYC